MKLGRKTIQYVARNAYLYAAGFLQEFMVFTRPYLDGRSIRQTQYKTTRMEMMVTALLGGQLTLVSPSTMNLPNVLFSFSLTEDRGSK
jgi:hypothetical protein